MNKSLLFSIIWTFPLEYIGQYWINRSHPMCNLPMCSSVPHVRHFFRNFVPRISFLQHLNLSGKISTPKLRKWCSSKWKNWPPKLFSTTYIIPSCFTINWRLFFKIGKKAYFWSKISSLCSGHCSLCETFFGEFMCCTLGITGVWYHG